jgi:hypothetical protein
VVAQLPAGAPKKQLKHVTGAPEPAPSGWQVEQLVVQ